MKNAVVFLSDGFEEVEALTQVDLLRRAGINAKTVSITDDKNVRGTHNINVLCDEIFENIDFENTDAIILPGGMPGTKNLNEHCGLKEKINEFYKNGKIVAAICAAPMIFGQMGILNGRKACCYPSFETYLEGADVNFENVNCDGNVITSRGVGTAIEFAGKLIEVLCGKEKSEEILEEILYKK